MIKIRIVPIDSEKTLDSKSSFWRHVSHVAEKESNYPEKLEYIFRKRFTKELKQDLQNKFRDELRSFENQYNVDFMHPFFDDYFHKYFSRLEKDERFYFQDFVNGIAKLQELKNDFFKDNKKYQELLSKNLLAAQIDFRIDNISYSSLGFDLSIEPIEKAIELFDNNFEYFRIFLDQYISDSFLSSMSIYNDRLPVDVSINYSDDFKKDFEKIRNPKSQKIEHTDSTEEKNGNKWEKAKWVWSLANGSLVVPVILALIILFVTFNKMDSIFKIRQDNYKEMQLENDKILKNYKELMEFQKGTYNDIVDKIKNDTIK